MDRSSSSSTASNAPSSRLRRPPSLYKTIFASSPVHKNRTPAPSGALDGTGVASDSDTDGEEDEGGGDESEEPILPNRHRQYPSPRSIPSLPLSPPPPAPSRDYLRRAALPSLPKQSPHPLIVVSLDGVIDCRLPEHLRGGWTDVLARPYLSTLMDFLLHPSSPWTVVYYTSLSQIEALKTLKSLKLPIGGPQKREEDGAGLFSREDMRGEFVDGVEVKDLEVIWDCLEKQEGIRFSLHDTVVLTTRPAELARQPLNYIFVPPITYREKTPLTHNQHLLLLIGILRDLETESSFPYRIQQAGWSQLKTWSGSDKDSTNGRNYILPIVLSICAEMRITVVATTGN